MIYIYIIIYIYIYLFIYWCICSNTCVYLFIYACVILCGYIYRYLHIAKHKFWVVPLHLKATEELAQDLSTSQTLEVDITIPDDSLPGDVLSLEVNGQVLEAPWRIRTPWLKPFKFAVWRKLRTCIVKLHSGPNSENANLSTKSWLILMINKRSHI